MKMKAKSLTITHSTPEEEPVRMKMTKNEHGAWALRPLVALLLAMALAGCDNGMSISEIEAKERASRLYTTAMEDLQAGRTDPAIRGFEQVLVQEFLVSSLLDQQGFRSCQMCNLRYQEVL